MRNIREKKLSLNVFFLVMKKWLDFGIFQFGYVVEYWILFIYIGGMKRVLFLEMKCFNVYYIVMICKYLMKLILFFLFLVIQFYVNMFFFV